MTPFETSRARRPDAGRHVRSSLRALAILALAFALVAPKVSLALSTLVGSGYRSVLVCTGTGLKRVTLSPSGQIVDESDTERGDAPGDHCVVTFVDVAELERGWDAVRYPHRVLVANTTPSARTLEPLVLRPGASSRGPPLPA